MPENNRPCSGLFIGIEVGVLIDKVGHRSLLQKLKIFFSWKTVSSCVKSMLSSIQLEEWTGWEWRKRQKTWVF